MFQIEDVHHRRQRSVPATALGHGEALAAHQQDQPSSVSDCAVTITMVRKVATGSSLERDREQRPVGAPDERERRQQRQHLGRTRRVHGRSGLVFFRRLEVSSRRCASCRRAAASSDRRRSTGRPSGPTTWTFCVGWPSSVDDLAEVEDARAIDRLVALPHHVHEDVGRAEQPLDRRARRSRRRPRRRRGGRPRPAADDVADRRAVGHRQGLPPAPPPARPARARGGKQETRRHGPSLPPVRSRRDRKLRPKFRHSPGLHRRGTFTRVRPSRRTPRRAVGCAPVAQLDRASDYGSEG